MNEKLPADEHNYRFVGKVGQFCPIVDGDGGGELLRESGVDKEGNTKYAADTNSKGYRWMESEMVRELGKESSIDKRFYDKPVNDAVDTISKYGDFEWFVSDDDIFKEAYYTPPWKMACGKDTCLTCPKFITEGSHMGCADGFDNSDMIYSLQDEEYFNKR